MTPRKNLGQSVEAKRIPKVIGRISSRFFPVKASVNAWSE